MRISILAVLVSFIFAGAAAAQNFQAGGSVMVEGTGQNGVRAAGGSVTVTGDINGAVWAAAGDVFIDAAIDDEVMAAAGQVSLNGQVGSNVFIAGGNTSVSADIAGDLQVATASVEVTEDARISGEADFAAASIDVRGRIDGDLNAAAASVDLTGAVGGDAEIYSASAFVNGIVEGDVRVEAEAVTIGPNARIFGDLVYSSTGEADIHPAADIKGDILFTEITQRELQDRMEERRDAFKGATAAFNAAFAIAVFVSGAALLLMFPALFGTTTRFAVEAPVMTGLIGFAGVIMMPIAAILLMVTILGGLLGLFVLVMYGLLFTLAYMAAATGLGGLILNREGEARGRVLYLGLGLLILVVLGFIPFIGGFLVFIATMVGFGAVLRTLLGMFRGPEAA